MSEQSINPAAIPGISSEDKPTIPQERIDAVITREQTKSVEAGNKASELERNTSDLKKQNQSINETKTQQEETARQVQRDTQIREGYRAGDERSFLGLGKFFGKKEREEQRQKDSEQIEEIRAKLMETEVEAAQTQEQLEQTRQEHDKNKQQETHSAEVAEANKLGGPMEGSTKMSEALSKQDSVKFYTEADYPVENVDYLFDKPIIDELISEMQKPEFSREIRSVSEYYSYEGFFAELKEVVDSGKARKHQIESFATSEKMLETLKKKMQNEIKGLIIGMTPFYEEIIKLADKENIPISQNLVKKSLIEGLKMSQGISSPYNDELKDFIKHKREGSSNLYNYDERMYSAGALQLDNFFKRYKNIKGRNRLPYIIAHSAGASANQYAEKSAEDLRCWLAESIPTPTTDLVRVDKEWIKEKKEPVAKGFGYALERNNKYSIFTETRDPDWHKTLMEANEICKKISNTLDEKGLPNVNEKFAGRWFGGYSTLVNPELILDLESID